MEPVPVLQINLTQLADGQVGIRVEGPASENLTAILGLLEFAKHNIMAQQQKRQQDPPPILPGGFVPRINGLRG